MTLLLFIVLGVNIALNLLSLLSCVCIISRAELEEPMTTKALAVRLLSLFLLKKMRPLYTLKCNFIAECYVPNK